MCGEMRRVCFGEAAVSMVGEGNEHSARASVSVQAKRRGRRHTRTGHKDNTEAVVAA